MSAPRTKPTYSKKDREDAAVALSITACTRAVGEYVDDEQFEDVSDAADELMQAAFQAVPELDANGDLVPWHEQWAEAESWVREGWCP